MRLKVNFFRCNANAIVILHNANILYNKEWRAVYVQEWSSYRRWRNVATIDKQHQFTLRTCIYHRCCNRVLQVSHYFECGRDEEHGLAKCLVRQLHINMKEQLYSHGDITIYHLQFTHAQSAQQTVLRDRRPPHEIYDALHTSTHQFGIYLIAVLFWRPDTFLSTDWSTKFSTKINWNVIICFLFLIQCSVPLHHQLGWVVFMNVLFSAL